MATDNFKFAPDSSSAPSRNCVAITPNDTTDLIFAAKALYVGVTGDISLIPLDGTTAILFKACPAGMILPVRAARVMATATTATNIVALL